MVITQLDIQDLYSDDKFESGLSVGIQKKKEINDRFSMGQNGMVIGFVMS